MEAPRTRHELDNLFASCFNALKSGEEEVSIDKLDALSQSISLLHIFSDNEEFDDVDTADVGLALVDYWLACAILRKPSALPLDPVLRQKQIRTAEAFFDSFLARCADFGLVPHQKDSRNNKSVSGREEKVARFQQIKAKKLALTDNNLDAREMWRIRLELACLETLDEFDGICREMEVLEYMAKMQPSSSQTPPLQPPAQRKPIEVTKIGPDFVMKKETFQDGVFKPYHRQPTISLEEYAEMEMQKLAENERRAKEAPQGSKPVLSLNELHEQGLEEDLDKMDAAIEKARKWDDWKDGVPKGSGVTKRF